MIQAIHKQQQRCHFGIMPPRRVSRDDTCTLGEGFCFTITDTEAKKSPCSLFPHNSSFHEASLGVHFSRRKHPEVNSIVHHDMPSLQVRMDREMMEKENPGSQLWQHGISIADQRRYWSYNVLHIWLQIAYSIIEDCVDQGILFNISCLSLYQVVCQMMCDWPSV